MQLLPIYILMMMMVVPSCSSRHEAESEQGDTLRLSHSQLLTIIQRPDSVVLVQVANPWKEGHTLQRYALVHGAACDVPSGYTEVRVPLQRAVVFTSVHLSLIEELGCMGQVAGVCDKQYINLPSALPLPDFGSSMSPNIEMLVAASPDALFVSPFENSGHGQMEKLGLPIIECADYMEASPLGRAEWMRFYAMLFGTDATALFRTVEASYDALRREPVGRTLLTDQLSGQAWYVPGGRSYLGRVYADAGADYVFGHREEQGSVALSFETVFSSARDADVWLIKYSAPQDLTLGQLAQSYPPYRQFKAFGTQNVYGCNTSRLNYYEDICFHPERLLRDVETVLDGNDGQYYQRLKP